MRGQIKRVFLPRGFGFLTGTDGFDYFFHVNDTHIPWEGSQIFEKRVVEFLPGVDPDNPRKLRAFNIKAV